MYNIEEVMRILECAVFDDRNMPQCKNVEKILEILDEHAVLPLIKPIWKKLNMTDEQRKKWDKRVLFYLYRNTLNIHEEQMLTNLLSFNDIQYVILKGSSFAQYYPEPTLRARGDIDLLVKEESFERAAKILIDEGYREDTHGDISNRNIKYIKNNIHVELHRYFSDVDIKSSFLDVSKAICTNDSIHSFPPLENGIVMLLHIRFHFGEVGLRHYMDWILYVKEVCDDTFWYKQLRKHADEYGLTPLAKALTKAGKHFFPFSNTTWCDDIDDSICDDVLEEFFESGDFRSNIARHKAITITSSNINPKYWISMITSTGVKNWKPAQKYSILIPIAFAKQFYIYTKWLLKEQRGVHIIDLLVKTLRRKRIRNKLFV